ncbi:MAG: FxLYD domain-containing protein [Pleurocapsa minor GSE-CHR-MK-17-07R]|jgi:hypothetical protein|nr:FxLYD domain-containing protein [Pleurocapsa minor GSE-CHR-MK 17-07R]
MRRWLSLTLGVVTAALAACSGGDAVVFAPTPAPPDTSPTRYTHPSGAFAADIPRQWPVYEQYTTTLASASFAPVGSDSPLLTFSLVNLGQDIDTASFSELISRYQTQVRADIASYVEQSREALGDGSFRITGLRRGSAGETEQVNTFIERSGSLLGVTEVIMPADAGIQGALEQAVNTFTPLTAGQLQPTDLTALAFARPLSLNILHTAQWTTPDGVFFVTGEVANYGAQTVTNVPIEAVLLTADGLSAGGAVDQVMGYGIQPGGFAPFSLRFGQGQPDIALRFELRLGGETWVNDPAAVIYGADALSWTDGSSYDTVGRLVLSGEVSNTSAEPIYNLRAVATVFDAEERVIGAAFSEVSTQLAPGDSTAYAVTVPDLGGDPVNYIISIQGTD